jgi:hypothetical protein
VSFEEDERPHGFTRSTDHIVVGIIKKPTDHLTGRRATRVPAEGLNRSTSDVRILRNA